MIETTRWTKVEVPKVEVQTNSSNKKRYIIPILIILLIIGVNGYFVYNMLQPNDEFDFETFKIGVQYGHKAVLLELFNEASKCEVISLSNNNVTITLISIDCLNK